MIKALAIPYKTFRDRIKIIRKLELKVYKVDYDDNFIYAEKHYKFLEIE